MKRRHNILLWAGFIVALLAVGTYIPIFAVYAATRDVPWVNYLLFAAGGMLLVLGLRRALKEGWSVAFSIDGPRGPRYKVKPGPVALARSSGVPLTIFHMAIDKAWVLNSWDRMMIPKPFSRVLMRFGKLIPVPAEATDEDIERYQQDLQDSLDRVREFSEGNVSKVGTAEFPYDNRT